MSLVNIELPDGVKIAEQRIKISATTAAALSEHTICLGKNAALNLILEWEGAIANTKIQIHLAERAQLQLTQLQMGQSDAQHHVEYAVTQAAHSQLRSQSYSLGAAESRELWEIALQGEQADCSCHGLAIASDKQQMHHQLKIRHAAPHCRSRQEFKAIATDHAKALFSGKVIVEKAGMGAQAHQHSQNLLLSTRAEIGAKPELEVYTDDVKASHGATVGQLDKDALFFLRARGIPLAQAEQILLQAFVDAHLQNLSGDIQAWLAPIVCEKLSQVRQYE